MTTDPLDVSSPLVNGLSHISLVAPSSDLFYSTVQFYESLGFQTVSLVATKSDRLTFSSTGLNLSQETLTMTFVPILKRRRGCIAGVKIREMMSQSKSV